jgi:hypothetical protein
MYNIAHVKTNKNSIFFLKTTIIYSKFIHLIWNAQISIHITILNFLTYANLYMIEKPYVKILKRYKHIKPSTGQFKYLKNKQIF